MPTKISDSKLATLYANFERQQQRSANFKLGREQALEILAQVGDRSGWSANRVLDELKKPGLSQEAQVALAQKGLSKNEKKDLETILDEGKVPLDPSARAFLEAVVGRSGGGGGAVGVNGLTVTGDQRDGLAGVTKAGATIEAINISAAPAGRLHMDDTMVVGKADAQGRFALAKLTGDQAMREGDLVRMRARYADGSTSDWVTIKAHGIEAKDTRNAVVALFRIGMTDAGNGKVAVENINASRQVSEPGAQLQFTNLRTGEKTKVTITETGGFPDGFKLNGKAGDSFSVAASDGTNNVDFSTAVGNVTVPGGTPENTDLVPDPALHKDELNADGTPKFGKKTFTGPLFVDGAKPGDVKQGQIGNCYFPAAIAALAQSNPEAITNMVKDNGDGTYTVTFKQRDWATGRAKDVPIKVDGDLYTRSWGGPLYGHSANSSDPRKMELWFPLIEKAYAQWKGSYDEIGNGGHVSDVFEDCLGVQTGSMGLSYSSPDKVWDRIVSNVDNHKALGAGTYGEDQEARYTNSGVYADHAYSILGYEKGANGERFVILRNPWGESEPAGNGPNDGVFKLKLEEFTKLYQTMYFVS
ncbi:MAG: C2 family cysteine protease [Myxococcota bacterium]|jgi:hypothetical protein